MTHTLLTVNAGSTSVKISLLRNGKTLAEYESLDDALDWSNPPDAVLHRVVHGGHRTGPVLLDDAVVAELRALTELAPLHQPPALDAIDHCRATLAETPQYACFDTAFHTTLPDAARTYALPRRLREQVRVYGFHGLSVAWASSQVGAAAPEARRVLVAHLGGGESLTGVVDGESIVTTMGFTPLDGLVMATRSGSVDPGAVLYLAEHTDEDLSVVLEKESGLLGLCGTADMSEVLSRTASGDTDAALALEVYLHRLVGQAGSCVFAMGGLDAIAFTGGVGEHAAAIREKFTDRLGWLGVSIGGGELPDATTAEITADGAEVRTFVVRAREDLQMAAEVAGLL